MHKNRLQILQTAFMISTFFVWNIILIMSLYNPLHPLLSLPSATEHPESHHTSISMFICLINLKRQFWSQNRLNCSFLFMLTLNLFYTFGYYRHCSGAYSCTCMKLYKSATRFLQLTGGCLKKCSFIIF